MPAPRHVWGQTTSLYVPELQWCCCACAVQLFLLWVLALQCPRIVCSVHAVQALNAANTDIVKLREVARKALESLKK